MNKYCENLSKLLSILFKRFQNKSGCDTVQERYFSVPRRIQNHGKHYMIERLKAVNYFHKEALPRIFDIDLNTFLNDVINNIFDIDFISFISILH